MDKAIPEFLQYGATGILALAFLVLLVLYVRADKRAQRADQRAERYADGLKEASFDRTQLIAVVADNTRTISELTAQLVAMNKTQDRMAAVLGRLDKRLDSDRCPFLRDESAPHGG